MGNFFNALTISQGKDYKLTDYINLADGEKITVQLLSPVESKFIHWMPTDGKRMPVKCLGLDNCPVCSSNRELEGGKEDSEYIATQARYLTNVLDLTPMKECPSCGTLNGTNMTTCANDECKTILVDVEPAPIKQVRYLEGSWTMFKQIEAMEDLLGEYKINQVPLSIKRTGSGGKTIYVVVPLTQEAGKYNPDEYKDDLFNLSEVGIILDYNEMVIVMNGGSFRAVMEARRGNKKEEMDNIFSD